MIEIFPNVSEQTRQFAKYWVDLALKQPKPIDGLKMVSDFSDSCFTEEEKNFVDFYFYMRMEQLKNESNND